ncbi:MAG: DEAD/DEAH box helicase [Deltaproteobacteria bacterium]|nr:DEAD/DEAH box helicase [Deltaproteobacteria bacterium]
MTFSVGSLVRARGREWVVLPDSKEDLLILRPLGGMDDEVTGIYLPLEPVEPATFSLPDPTQVGDFRSCRLLRDAVRLGFRSSTGPFRSFAKIGVEPRPYQLVPLLMALKLDPVRLLIADDVGIGKTIEALLAARELLDRGEVKRLAVLCPPHLAEQWQGELNDKFHIQAEVVLPSTVSRLERICAVGQSLFDVYPYVVVSMDYIKSDRRQDEFLRACPELIIVDEAHTCAYAEDQRSGRHQRHKLIKGLAQDPDRHMILVTATPHSGKEEAFRSLLTFVDSSFANLPEDLTGPENESQRRRVAAHFVQRRRADIRHYMKTQTPFPARKEAEETYVLGEDSDYKRLFERVLTYARETVADPEGGAFRQRVRWWSALALLRSLASSPAAAAATLRNRASAADTQTPEEADEIGRRTVLDLDLADATEDEDLVPGSDPGEEDPVAQRNRRLLLQMAREADALRGKKDTKLQKAIPFVKDFIKDGFHPILFCRFIPTAEYVALALREALPNDVAVSAVTGTIPPAEREARVLQLAENPKRVLVCTDCLSEGINLQDHFDAVMHYDLSWNPTRHEQREGRVDRFGQPRDKVRVLTYYGLDNQIDGVVLDVLLRKHKKIRSALGISVPVPANTDMVIEAIFEGLLLNDDLHAKWDDAMEREKRSRTMFAQETIKVDEVAKELTDTRTAIGSGVEVARFVQEAFQSQGAVITGRNKQLVFDIAEVPRALKDAISLGDKNRFKARFELPVDEGVLYLNRTHPVVEALANYVMNTSLDPMLEAIARRCGVIRTRKVERRTTVLLVRFRYYIITAQKENETPLLAEECRVLAFRGAPDKAEWLDETDAETLLFVEPDANISPDLASNAILKINEGIDSLRSKLEEVAQARAEELLQAHRRVRTAARIKGLRYGVEPHLPPDVLGIYVYLPVI